VSEMRALCGQVTHERDELKTQCERLRTDIVQTTADMRAANRKVSINNNNNVNVF
jgi:chromosome segregation ATPase